MSCKDKQRFRVYNCEDKVEYLDRQLTERKIRNYFNKIMCSDYIQKNWPTRPNKVKLFFYDKNYSYYSVNEIWISREQLQKFILCHECAHSLPQKTANHPHGPKFVKRYLNLLKRFHNKKFAKRLEYHFIKNKVKF